MNASNRYGGASTTRCPLSVDEQRELVGVAREDAGNPAATRVFASFWKENRGEGRRLLMEEMFALESEQSETESSLRRLEDSIPLSDEEARFLRDQTDQRAPLAERRGRLRTREDALNELLAIKTPGSLRVSPNDSLRLRLMEKMSSSTTRAPAGSSRLGLVVRVVSP